MTNWKNSRAEAEMRKAGEKMMEDALVSKAIADGKLPYTEWLKKYFTNEYGGCTNIWEQVEEGFAIPDLSRFEPEDLDEEYMCYLKGIEGNCDSKQYEE